MNKPNRKQEIRLNNRNSGSCCLPFYGFQQKQRVIVMSTAENVTAPEGVSMVDENKIINIDILVIAILVEIICSLFFKSLSMLKVLHLPLFPVNSLVWTMIITWRLPMLMECPFLKVIFSKLTELSSRRI